MERPNTRARVTKGKSVPSQRKSCTKRASILTQIKKMLTVTITPLIRRIEEMESNTSSCSRSENSNTNLSTEPEANVSLQRKSEIVFIQSPHKPTFNGTSAHPVVFMEDLEKYIEKMNISHGDVRTILECLTGDAKNWAKIYEDRWRNFNDFKEDFLSHYWGREAQNKVKQTLGFGKWDARDMTMSVYFAKLYSDARRLPLFLTEEIIVDEIMQHFPREVRTLWFTRELKGAIAASKFLRNIEGTLNESLQRNNAPKTTRTISQNDKPDRNQYNMRWSKGNAAGNRNAEN